MNKAIILLIAMTFAFMVLACAAPQSAPTSSGGSPNSNRDTMTSQSIIVEEPEVEGEISLARNYYFTIDNSGSMDDRSCGNADLEGNQRRIDIAKSATIEFISKSVNPQTNVGVHAFNSGELVPLGIGNRDFIVEEVSSLGNGGGTPLSDSIKRSVDALDLQRKKQLGYGEFYVVVVTDGEAGVESGVRYAREHDIPIITIGFCLTSDHPLAQYSISYRNANNRAELLKALEETQGEVSFLDPAFENIPGITK